MTSRKKITGVDLVEVFKILYGTGININFCFQCGTRRQDKENINRNEKRTNSQQTQIHARNNKCAEKDFMGRIIMVKFLLWAGM